MEHKELPVRGEKVVVSFAGINPALCIDLGKVNYSRAQSPLGSHIHEGSMEFVYVVKGQQFYSVDGTDYTVNSGEMFFTHADEPHSTSGHPEDKSFFYYLIINTEKIPTGFIGYDEAEGEAICNSLAGMKQRVFKARPDTKKILDGLISCYNSDCAIKATIVRNLVSSFLINAIESAQKSVSIKGIALHDVLDYIEKNISDDIPLRVLAILAGLSVPRFKASFRKHTGIPPHEYVLRRKVESAKVLLANTGLSITDISYKLSFSSSQYFATVFKRYTSVSPSEYRNILRCRTAN